jgi:hypothetical protein
VTINVPASSVDYALNLQTASGNGSMYKVKVFGPPSPSSGGVALKVDGSNASSSGTLGNAATFTPPSKTLGVYTFNYAIVDPDGNSSGTAQATVRVQPSAFPDTLSVKKSSAKADIDVGANDGAFVGTTFTVTTALSGTCGTLDTTGWATSGKVKYTPPTTAKTCSFAYKLVPTDTSYTTTNIVTVTITVTN